MSRLLARSLVVGSTMSILIACAQIADIQDPDPSTSASNSTPTGGRGTNENPTAPTPTTTGTTGVPGTPGTGTPGTPTPVPDAGADTSTPPPTCSMKPINATCGDSSECCSTHCGQNKVCVSGCDQTGCDGAFAATCCIGNYCGNSFTCKPCIAQGSPADRFLVGNGVNERSCCSGNASGGNCL